MIERMRFVNIMGKISDIDRVIDKYISNYEIQLENTLKEIGNAGPLTSCVETNPYTEYLLLGEKFAKSTKLNLNGKYRKIDGNEALTLIKEAYHFFEKRDENLKSLEEKADKISEYINAWAPFSPLNFDVSVLKDFEFIKYRFGKMPIDNYKQFEAYVYNQNDILFVESKRDQKFVYGVYFVPLFNRDRVDTVLSSLNFERSVLPFDLNGESFFGTPQKVLNMLNSILEATEGEINTQQAETLISLGINNQDIVNSYNTLKELSYGFDLRKYAAKTIHNYYIFIGWMPEEEAKKLEKDAENDAKVILVLEDSLGAAKQRPPTKLKNNILVKPFEFFVKTYGLPKYDELDPTPFVALTYFFLFGVMFGDLGQGFCLSAIGYLIYKFNKMELGKIMLFIGISSMIFGVLYGSVFGIEHAIPALWMKPSENINNILMISVGAGVFLIFSAMALNIINAVKQKDIVKLLLGPNGLSGIVFYAALLGMGLSVFLANAKVAVWLIVIFIAIPLLLIAFRDPIGQYLNGKKATVESGVPMFLLETVIELFEVLLTYFTNTVSFVRVGAFALSHAGMMSVVLLMAELPSGGYNPVVMVLGNILVMLMEGLVVGIQVLRIEFYELFSRYYEGGGREFVPTVYNKE